MKYVGFVALAVVTICVLSSEATECIPKGETCDVRHSELCSTRYCRDQECIQFGTVYDDSETKDPCRKHNCSKNQVCTYNQVQCVRSPCGPVMSCVDKSKVCTV